MRRKIKHDWAVLNKAIHLIEELFKTIDRQQKYIDYLKTRLEEE